MSFLCNISWTSSLFSALTSLTVYTANIVTVKELEYWSRDSQLVTRIAVEGQSQRSWSKSYLKAKHCHKQRKREATYRWRRYYSQSRRRDNRRRSRWLICILYSTRRCGAHYVENLKRLAGNPAFGQLSLLPDLITVVNKGLRLLCGLTSLLHAAPTKDLFYQNLLCECVLRNFSDLNLSELAYERGFYFVDFIFVFRLSRVKLSLLIEVCNSMVATEKAKRFQQPRRVTA